MDTAPVEYRKPEVIDYGTLRQLTENCLGSGALDEFGKDFQADSFSTPLDGDPNFCSAYP
jgi:hypothetical protein